MAVAAASNAIITKAEYKEIIKVPGTVTSQEDDQLQHLINSVSGLIEKETGHKFKEETFTGEERSGAELGDRSFFYTDWHPITTFTSLTEDGRVLTEDTDFVVLSRFGKIVRYGSSSVTILIPHPGRFNYGFNNLVYTYKAGYTTGNIPSDIKVACAYIVRAYQLGPRSGTVDASSITVGGQSVTVIPDSLPKHAKIILDKYSDINY